MARTVARRAHGCSRLRQVCVVSRRTARTESADVCSSRPRDQTNPDAGACAFVFRVPRDFERFDRLPRNCRVAWETETPGASAERQTCLERGSYIWISSLARHALTQRRLRRVPHRQAARVIRLPTMLARSCVRKGGRPPRRGCATEATGGRLPLTIRVTPPRGTHCTMRSSLCTRSRAGRGRSRCG
jgi:hypothetical protein